jgi:hypothetical protein
VLACATVAAFLEQPVWAAAAGSGLVLLYWALEALAWRSAARGTFDHAVAAAVGGAALRMALVLVCLVLVGVLARAAFPAAALGFLAAFTVYLGVRVYVFAGAPVAARGARPR